MLAVDAAAEPNEKRRSRIKHGETFLSRKFDSAKMMVMENDWRWKRAGNDESEQNALKDKGDDGGETWVITVKDKKRVKDTIKSDLNNFSSDLDCALCQEFKNGESVKACDVSAGAQMVAFAGTSKEVTVCGLVDGKEKWKGKHAEEIRGCQFSGDGQLLATCGDDKLVKIWNTANGEIKYEYPPEQGCLLTVAWSHDGKMLATGGDNKMIRVWSHDKPETLIFEHVELPQPVNVVRFSGDGKWFGIAGGKGDEGGFVYVYKLNKR
jgi:WD40 repeat protein